MSTSELAHKVTSGLTRYQRRGQKYLRLRARQYARHLPHDRHGLFIVGCQRSGTSMLLQALDQSDYAWVYSGDSRRAFDGRRLRDANAIESLIQRSPASLTVFKPLAESQWIDRILDRHPSSRAIWLYRHYGDVSRSAVRKWGGHQRAVVQAIAAGRGESISWRGERLAPDSVQFLQTVIGTHADLSPVEGALLTWWLRNTFYFQLDLAHDERVALARYEDLVTAPGDTFPLLFARVGCPYDPAVHAKVHDRAVSNKPVDGAASSIVDACEALLDRLRQGLAPDDLHVSVSE